MLGGQALAEIIAGDCEPQGRLTISFPKHVGQQPSFYSQVRGQHGHRYADMDQEPAFAFGEGLTYSSVRYSDLTIAETSIALPELINKCSGKEFNTANLYALGNILSAQVTLTNTGTRPHTEVVQAYISDVQTSVTWVDYALATFERITLAPGETQTITLDIPASALRLIDADAQSVIEPGKFELRVGPNSRKDTHLVAEFTVTE